MSFSDEIKLEIIEYWQKKSCCRLCEAYGMILFLNKNGAVRFMNKNYDVVRHFRSLLKKCFDLSKDIQTTDSGNNIIKISAMPNNIGHDISFVDFVCDNCKSAFLRGAFLAVGQCSDPNREYHLEFVSSDESLSYFLCKMLIECGFDAKTSERRQKNSEKYVVYLKKSADIEDFLTLINAQKCALKMMEAQVVKAVRNNINRTTNFQTANIKKSSQSCAKQLDAINRLEMAGKLRTLPDDLYELSVQRRDYIDLSLSELGAKFGLSRAGIHHRLQKIIQLADDLCK